MLVVEDKYNPGELKEEAGLRVPRNDNVANPSADDTAVVGFAVRSMRPTHSRYGQFALESPCTYAARPLARDIHHQGHADLLDALMYQLRAKHFTNCA